MKATKKNQPQGFTRTAASWARRIGLLSVCQAAPLLMVPNCLPDAELPDDSNKGPDVNPEDAVGVDGYCPSPGRNQARFNMEHRTTLGAPTGWLGCMRKELKDKDGGYTDNMPTYFLEELKPCEGPIHEDDECQSSSDCGAGKACFCHGWFDGGEDEVWLAYLTMSGKKPRPQQMITYRNMCVPNHCEDGCNDRGCTLAWTDDSKSLEMNCHTKRDLCIQNDDCFGRVEDAIGEEACAYIEENKRWECVDVGVSLKKSPVAN